jgi:glutamate synthase domain-containing protein 2
MDAEERLNGSSNWEEQCVDAAECELNTLEEKLAAEREENSQRIWLSFQNAANAVAQLFRGWSVSVCNKWDHLSHSLKETGFLCFIL